jgi:hypothetical protein
MSDPNELITDPNDDRFFRDENFNGICEEYGVPATYADAAPGPNEDPREAAHWLPEHR